MINSIILALIFFLIKIEPNINEQENKWQRIYYLPYAETKPKTPKIMGVSLWLLSNLNLCGAFWKTKKNTNSHPNKTAIEEEWNKMSEEFTLKACKSFQRRVNTIIEKNGGHIKYIYSFVSIFLLCCLFFLKLILIIFYYVVIYCYTRLFLI